MRLGWVFAWLLAARALELLVSWFNARRLLARGGKEYAPASFRHIALMHGLFIAALAVEAWPWRIPLNSLSVGCLVALLVLQAGRWWCMVSLGEKWNVRIIVIPGEKPLRTGPYRWLRHPNYLLVTLEFILLPLLMRAWVTLAVFSLANLLLLWQRIRQEESALAQAAQGVAADQERKTE